MAGTKLPAATWLPYWYQALDQELGIYIEVVHRRLFVNALYDARKKSGDPRLEALMIFQPGEGIVYICKKEVELGNV